MRVQRAGEGPACTQAGPFARSAEDCALMLSAICGPDPERHLEAIRKGFEAGYDHVHVYQVGPDQDGFFSFYESEVLPKLR